MFTITNDRISKDMLYASKKKTKDNYEELYKEISVPKRWSSKLNLPPLEQHHRFNVLRCDLVGGFKALAAEKFIAGIKSKHLVYCAPRTGHAALAIAKLAKMYGKQAIFFAPSSKRCTPDQACVLAYGAQLRFVRIAAMPVLNSYAKKWAEANDAVFLPFGLAYTPEITAGIVNLCNHLSQAYKAPKEIWCATSTGTMIRGLEIGFPKAKLRTIAVARNIHSGEIGNVDIVSASVPFLTKAKTQPPFPTTACYDAKAWEECIKRGSKHAWFINVGSDKMVEQDAAQINLDKIDSFREWHDFKDLERGI